MAKKEKSWGSPQNKHICNITFFQNYSRKLYYDNGFLIPHLLNEVFASLTITTTAGCFFPSCSAINKCFTYTHKCSRNQNHNVFIKHKTKYNLFLQNCNNTPPLSSLHTFAFGKNFTLENVPQQLCWAGKHLIIDQNWCVWPKLKNKDMSIIHI